MVNKSNLDPENFKTSPYTPDRIPPPGLEELAKLGLKPESDEKSVPITTRVRPAFAFAMDRIIERRVYNIRSRQEFFRLAIMNLISQFEEEIEQDHVRLLVKKLEDQRRLHAELLQMRHAVELITTTQKVVDMFLSFNNRFGAIQALRNAKRYAEEISFEGLRTKFVNSLYGSPDGNSKPFGWEQNEGAMLWHKVWEGELDRDTEELDRKQIRLF